MIPKNLHVDFAASAGCLKVHDLDDNTDNDTTKDEKRSRTA